MPVPLDLASLACLVEETEGSYLPPDPDPQYVSREWLAWLRTVKATDD